MTDVADSSVPLASQAAIQALPRRRSGAGLRVRQGAERFAIPVGAVLAAFALFSVFLLLVGKSPLTFLDLVWQGGYGSAFSWGNTL